MKIFPEKLKTNMSILIFAMLITLLASIVINFYFILKPSTSIQSAQIEKISSEQEYVNLLKEINLQSQLRLDSQISFYSWITGSLALVTGFFTISLIYISFVGWKEFERVRSQREEVSLILDEQQTLLSEKKDELKAFVRDNVRDLVDYSAANMLFRLDRFDLANETIPQIGDHEKGPFTNDIRLLTGKIKYKLGKCDESIEYFQQLEKNIDSLTYHDLMGAAYKKKYRLSPSKDPDILDNAMIHFQEALKVTNGENNGYERRRALLNIQAVNLWLNNNDDVISIFEKEFKIATPGKSEDPNLETRLNVGGYITAIYAYWKKHDINRSLDLIESLSKVFDNDIDGMEDYINHNFNVDPNEVDKIFNMYHEHKTILDAKQKNPRKNGK